MTNLIYEALGLNTPIALTLFEMLCRAVAMYFFGIIFSTLNKQIMGIRSSLNLVILIMLGSLFATAITSVETFIPIIITLSLLTVVNKILIYIIFHVPLLEKLLKGAPPMLVKNGEICWQNMRENFITKHELINELKTQLHTDDLALIAEATLATDGTINFIEKEHSQ